MSSGCNTNALGKAAWRLPILAVLAGLVSKHSTRGEVLVAFKTLRGIEGAGGRLHMGAKRPRERLWENAGIRKEAPFEYFGRGRGVLLHGTRGLVALLYRVCDYVKLIMKNYLHHHTYIYTVTWFVSVCVCVVCVCVCLIFTRK